MHFFWELENCTETGSNIRSLSWMGRVPNEMTEEASEWRLNRFAYYQEGWLATGNDLPMVGVTYTSTQRRHSIAPARTNYNLRGHRCQVVYVSWNEPYQKLATCDTSGIIFVWIKYEGRWSIELVNDRNTPVSHFSWSHDGRMALISYQDGFVLVGSVAGQRYWSFNLHLNTSITWGAWTPNDQQVYFGCKDGCVVAMDVHGSMVSNLCLNGGDSIVQLVWNCEKFKMEERDNTVHYSRDQTFILAVSFTSGTIHLMDDINDVTPVVLQSGMTGILMEWCNNGEVLAVCGTTKLSLSNQPQHNIQLYSKCGVLYKNIQIPGNTAATALTWGHNDRRLFVATGSRVHVARVSFRIASLESLCRLAICSSVGSGSVQKIPLPAYVRQKMRAIFTPTIKCCIPRNQTLRRFVTRLPEKCSRLYCTMLRQEGVSRGANLASGDERHFSSVFTLNLEFLGGLIPILGAVQVSKLRPQFVVFDLSDAGEADTPVQECCTAIPQSTRVHSENHDILQVSSNLWGTKFRLTGLANWLPLDLGSITYRTSMLHLQPRQMSLVVTELTADLQSSPRSPPNEKKRVHNPPSEKPVLDWSREKKIQIDLEPKLKSELLAESEQSVASQKSEGFLASEKSKQQEDLHRYERIITPEEKCSEEVLTCSPGNKTKRAEQAESASRNAFYERKSVRRGLPGDSLTRIRHSVRESKKSGYSGGDRSLNEYPCEEMCYDDQLSASLSSRGVWESHLHSGPIPESADVRWQHQKSRYAGSRSSKHRLQRSQLQSSHQEDRKEGVDFSAEERPVAPSRRLPSRSISLHTIIRDVSHLDIASHASSNQTPIVLVRGSCGAKGDRSESTERDTSAPPKSASVGQMDALNKVVSKPECAPIRNCIASTTNRNAQRSSPENTNDSNPLAHIGSSSLCARTDFDNSEFYRQQSSASGSNRTEITSACPRATVVTGSTESVQQDSPDTCYLPNSTETHSVYRHKSRSNRRNRLAGLVNRLESQENSFNSRSLLTARDHGHSIGLFIGQERLCLSTPNSPLLRRKNHTNSSASPIRKRLLNSPLLCRRAVVSSDEEEQAGANEVAFDCITGSAHERSHDKSQKIVSKHKIAGAAACIQQCTPLGGSARQLMMANISPVWNEASQVYQLDFGGRVTQESAKNFQIQYSSEQVMQFGRIDTDTYTLDFQYPFTAVQAFAVALANITQRFK